MSRDSLFSSRYRWLRGWIATFGIRLDRQAMADVREGEADYAAGRLVMLSPHCKCDDYSLDWCADCVAVMREDSNA